MLQRDLYTHAQLVRLIDAQSVAVVGVSANEVGLGSRTLANLQARGYRGQIYPVNVKYQTLGGLECHPSITELPQVPDCVVIAAPREAVEAVVMECVGKGVGGIIIYASGYAETPKPGRLEQQQRLQDIARDARIPIIGPNCIGVLNYATGFHPSFLIAPASPPLRPGAIGLVSQSGALAFSLAQAVERGIGLSHVLTSGNACDVDVADQVAYLAADPACTAIACVFEGMAQPQRLLAAAQVAHRAGKPVVVYKMATGDSGAAAAMSHTGSLAGSDAAYRAAFQRAGMVMVDDFEALLETAAFFAKAPPPLADGIAVLAASGGSCIMAADKAERHGVALPQPGVAASVVLASVIPEFGTVRNPCDVTAQGFLGEGMARTVEAMMADPLYSAVVLPRILALPDTDVSVRIFSKAAKRHGKIACAVWMSEWMEGPGARETEADPHVAMFRSMERCFRTLAAWHERARWSRAQPRQVLRLTGTEVAARVGVQLAECEAGVIAERPAKALLAHYGVPVVEERLATTADEAVAAARALGYPVALKVESPDIAHKTEAGVIRLHLKDEAAVRQAWSAVMDAAKTHSPSARIHGGIVQPMVSAGVEIVVGARVDPLFGPLLLVGLGGVFVELLKDTVTALAPITPAEATRMLLQLRGAAVLRGFRGAPAVDVDRLSEVIARVSEFAADQQEHITEIDVNPLICSGNSILAVDALIVVRSTPGSIA